MDRLGMESEMFSYRMFLRENEAFFHANAVFSEVITAAVLSLAKQTVDLRDAESDYDEFE